MIVVFKSHLEIETGELGQVSVSVGILGSEDGTNLVHLLHIGCNGHLLGQLRRLGQERRAAEVVNLEDGRTGLGSRGLEFRRLDLGETLGVEERSEKICDAGAETENGVGYWGTKVDNPVGETSSLANTRVVGIGPSKFSKGTTGILDLEWKCSRGSSDYMKLQIHARMSQMKS